MSAAGNLPAVLGGEPAFVRPIASAQRLPRWDRVREAFAGIFERRYFANNGPLVRRLDAALAAACGVEHAVCVANESVAWLAAVEAFEPQGAIGVEGRLGPATADALRAAGLEPVSREASGVQAYVAVHAFGIPCDMSHVRAAAAQRGVPLFVDATQAMHAPAVPGVLNGDAVILSFSQATVLNAGEGGAVLTNSARIAARLRTIRNFSAAQTFAHVRVRQNAKMSEAQAALVLAGLDDLPEVIAASRAVLCAYDAALQPLKGIALVTASAQSVNAHYVPVEVRRDECGLTAAELATALQRENVLAEHADGGVLLLPSGEGIAEHDVFDICGALERILQHAAPVQAAVGDVR